MDPLTYKKLNLHFSKQSETSNSHLIPPLIVSPSTMLLLKGKLSHPHTFEPSLRTLQWNTMPDHHVVKKFSIQGASPLIEPSTLISLLNHHEEHPYWIKSNTQVRATSFIHRKP